ncbi:MAG: hypothetical protein WDZ64_00420 [Parcubacteria group bacterium]
MEENKTKFSAKSLILSGLVIFLLIFLVTQFSVSNLASGNIKKDVEKMYEACEGLQGKENCYAKAFDGLTRTSDMNYAFSVLRELQKKDTQARGCHFIAHSISTAETQKDTTKWREVMNSAPQDCSYGGAHGAIEVYASSFPDGKLPKEEIPFICENPDTKNCTHGLGHLILIETENDIEESLAICHSLPHQPIAIFECLTGVFMERITALNLEVHGLAGPEALNWAARVPELEALCRAQSGTNSIACWKEIVHAVVVRERNNAQAVVNFCEKAPAEVETRQCIDHALGILTAGYDFDLSKMSPICEARAQASDFPNRCTAHLVSAVLSTTPQETESAVRYCNQTEPQYQKDCFSMIGNTLYMASTENKANLSRACQKAPDEFQTLCQFGGPTDIIFYSGN